ncbi:hypothetical protein D9M73_127320 [compost metagenome]
MRISALHRRTANDVCIQSGVDRHLHRIGGIDEARGEDRAERGRGRIGAGDAALRGQDRIDIAIANRVARDGREANDPANARSTCDREPIGRACRAKVDKLHRSRRQHQIAAEGDRADGPGGAGHDHAAHTGEERRVEAPRTGNAARQQQIVARRCDRAVIGDEALQLVDVDQAGQRSAAVDRQFGGRAIERQPVDRHRRSERGGAGGRQRYVKIARVDLIDRVRIDIVRHEVGCTGQAVGERGGGERGRAGSGPRNGVGDRDAVVVIDAGFHVIADVIGGIGFLIADLAEFSRCARGALTCGGGHAVDQRAVDDDVIGGIEVGHPMRRVSPIAVARKRADITIWVRRGDIIPIQIKRLVEGAGAVAARGLRAEIARPAREHRDHQLLGIGAVEDQRTTRIARAGDSFSRQGIILEDIEVETVGAAVRRTAAVKVDLIEVLGTAAWCDAEQADINIVQRSEQAQIVLCQAPPIIDADRTAAGRRPGVAIAGDGHVIASAGRVADRGGCGQRRE